MTIGQLPSLLRSLRRLSDATGAAAPGDGTLLERFVRDGDEDAFTELVRRHGPMVLGVCRRVLGGWHEAEDAFQTTFLLLVRKAGQLRQPDALGPFLHGVAYRTALKARTQARRRRDREQPLQEHSAPVREDVVWRELASVLDSAISQLPIRYRTPFILCYLQGLTGNEAARQLGCAPGTIGTRLARAREWLRVRLARRGVTLSAAMVSSLLIDQSLSAAVPFGLIHKAVAAATGTVPAAVALLLKGVCQSMFLDKIRVVLLTLTALTVVGLGSGTVLYRALGEEPPRVVEPPPPSRPAPPVVPPAVAAPPVKEERPTATYRTPNFLVTAPSQRMAQLIGASAERHRTDQALTWLRKELPAWSKPCPIRVTVSMAGSGGATSFAFDNGRVLSMDMHVEGTLDQLLASVVPHEVTHTILASHFRCPIPRWADEGVAVMSEDDVEKKRQQKMIQEILDTPGRAIPLKRLLTLTQYPPDVMVVFAEGYSLTRFLVGQRDNQTFLRFVKDGMKDGWDKAVKEHYDLANVEALEAAWLAKVRGKGTKITPEPEPKVALPKGPGPITTRAVVTDLGKLGVQYLVHYYRPVTMKESKEGEPLVHPVTTYVRGVTAAWKLHDLDQVSAFDVHGKPIEETRLRKLLARETTVVVSADGKPVAPFYLSVLKEGTIVLVLPQAKTAPTPAAPPAPPVHPLPCTVPAPVDP